MRLDALGGQLSGGSAGVPAGETLHYSPGTRDRWVVSVSAGLAGRRRRMDRGRSGSGLDGSSMARECK
jgi:hypothetical protein